MDWTEKYRPRSLSEVRGNDKARDQLAEWAKTWEDHRKAVLVYGTPGVGKTSAAHALAADMGWSVVELNASDQRTADVIERVAGEAARSGTLTGGSGGRKLVVLDEADNIHGTYDRGGTRALTRLVKEASQPIVLIANEYYDVSRGLRSACEEVEFRSVSKRSIVPVLRDICRREGVEYEDEALDALAAKNSGDLRSAINDLQALAETNAVLQAEDVVTGDRDRSTDIFAFLDAVLKEKSAQEALYTAYDVDETPDALLKWVEDKAPKVYEGRELADAYEFLANADRWLGRVRASQEYRYWRYATDNVAAGVAAVRERDRGGWTRYGGAPFRSRKDATRDYVARKLAASSGVSMETARSELLPFLAAMTHHCRNRELTVAMAAHYDLDAEHVAYVTGSGKTTKKVTRIVEEARERAATAAVAHSEGAFEGGSASGDADLETAAARDDEDAEAGGETTDEADTEADAGMANSQSGLDDFF